MIFTRQFNNSCVIVHVKYNGKIVVHGYCYRTFLLCCGELNFNEDLISCSGEGWCRINLKNCQPIAT